ncbi:5'(3')-deoxyribonucleotidase [Zeaxanthinibacter sp. PT1]|uniref:5' nucleotidase, NT5C type n=1 Tax=Zeaxanthinibacter TaxID=561554 RepID=UPI002348FF48|nr:5'(3')-deoxyribonucleotidase [Zeaxanthinibacter sp. PT1]MDC6351058.1 5'(3')-deoxyribonucleotidase [Zeaxanthinibacter sp. PT1]
MILYLDMDEVLADTYGAHIEIYNQEFGENLTKEDCMGREVWQSVPEARQQSVKDHARQEGFFRPLKPIEDSIRVVKELQRKHEIYIASAAMQFPNSLREKSDWLDEHFPFIPWQNRILLGHKHILDGDVLIDDRSYNLKNFKGRGMLFTSPHNVNENHYERVNTWTEIAGLLL